MRSKANSLKIAILLIAIVTVQIQAQNASSFYGYSSLQTNAFSPYFDKAKLFDHSNRWIYPNNNSGSTCGYLGWLGYNSGFGGYHLAQDYCNSQGVAVLAADSGKVIFSGSVGGYGGPSGGTSGGVVVIRHRASDGTWFTGIYGHLDNLIANGTYVEAGQQIGISNNWSPPHVHFGIKPGYKDTVGSDDYRGYTSSTSNTYGFTNPVDFLNSKSACRGALSVGFRPNGTYPVHPNGSLIKSASNGTVYVLQSGQKRPVSSLSVLYNLYPNGGFYLKDVVTVADDELNSYTTGSGVFSQLPGNGKSQPDGTLIKKPSGEISIVSNNGQRRPFTSFSGFTGLGYMVCNVVDVDDATYNSYPQGSLVTY